MNCKPGDLAFYRGIHHECWGRVVKVVKATKPNPRPGTLPVDGAWWEIDPPLEIKGSRRFQCADSALNPIRDPGEDAQDETLSWLPVPSTEKEGA